MLKDLQNWIDRQLAGRSWGTTLSAEVFAPANIALCKYWGKRDAVWNLPVTDSVSISLGTYGSRCSIALGGDRDHFSLNGEDLSLVSPFAVRLTQFLDLFRGDANWHYQIAAHNTIPTAAGFASSASGFAAVVLALNALHGWHLDSRILSCFARIGSGSACRSLWDGFVHWHAGELSDGSDSFAEPVQADWSSLRVGLLHVETGPKPVSSRVAMIRTVETSSLYDGWPRQVAHDLETMLRAIAAQDLEVLGACLEENALSMHATMMAARPPVLYWQPETVAMLQKVWQVRSEGLPVYFTMDAGPNVKLLFDASVQDAVQSHFPGVAIANPWLASGVSTTFC